MHFNARSLLSKIESLNIWLLDFPADITTISETWFSPELDEVLANIIGYTCCRHDRATKARGGGLAINVRDELHASFDHLKHQELSVSSADSELSTYNHRKIVS